ITASFETRRAGPQWVAACAGTSTGFCGPSALCKEGDHMKSARSVEPAESTGAAPLSARLVGTWKLRSRIDVTASGEQVQEPTLGSDPVALVYFDKGGNFAAQFMKRDRSAAEAAPMAAAGSNNTRVVGGYDAYFGTYVVDEVRGVATTTL